MNNFLNFLLKKIPLNLFYSKRYYLFDDGGFKADRDNLANDWQVIANDMKCVTKRYEQ
jgi:hypothetical protein